MDSLEKIPVVDTPEMREVQSHFPLTTDGSRFPQHDALLVLFAHGFTIADAVEFGQELLDSYGGSVEREIGAEHDRGVSAARAWVIAHRGRATGLGGEVTSPGAGGRDPEGQDQPTYDATTAMDRLTPPGPYRGYMGNRLDPAAVRAARAAVANRPKGYEQSDFSLVYFVFANGLDPDPSNPQYADVYANLSVQKALDYQHRLRVYGTPSGANAGDDIVNRPRPQGGRPAEPGVKG